MFQIKYRFPTKLLTTLCLLAALSTLACINTQAEELLIELELPRLDVQPYHKPYVAVWLEDENRQHVATLALWAKEDTWYKDLRQWWRKIGRKDPRAYDAVSGATRLPGEHKISWNNEALQLEAGTYLLNFEASREEGGRSYHRKALKLGEKQTLTLPADGEFGSIQISLE